MEIEAKVGIKCCIYYRGLFVSSYDDSYLLGRQIGQCWQVQVFHFVSLPFIVILVSAYFPLCFLTITVIDCYILPFKIYNIYNILVCLLLLFQYSYSQLVSQKFVQLIRYSLGVWVLQVYVHFKAFSNQPQDVVQPWLIFIHQHSINIFA